MASGSLEITSASELVEDFTRVPSMIYSTGHCGVFARISALKLQDEDARVAERIIAEELARLDKERAERKATE